MYVHMYMFKKVTNCAVLYPEGGLAFLRRVPFGRPQLALHFVANFKIEAKADTNL